MEKIRIRYMRWKTFGSGINIPDPPQHWLLDNKSLIPPVARVSGKDPAQSSTTPSPCRRYYAPAASEINTPSRLREAKFRLAARRRLRIPARPQPRGIQGDGGQDLGVERRIGGAASHARAPTAKYVDKNFILFW